MRFIRLDYKEIPAKPYCYGQFFLGSMIAVQTKQNLWKNDKPTTKPCYDSLSHYLNCQSLNFP